MGRKKNSALLEAIETAEEYVESAIDHAKDFFEDTAKPALSDARDKAAPVVADARKKAAPVVAAGAATVATKAAQAKDFAETKAAEATGKKPKKRSKIKMLLLFGAIGGAVAVIAKKLQAGASEQSSPWQSDYKPAAPPTPPTPTAVQDPVTEEDAVPEGTHGDPLGEESRSE